MKQDEVSEFSASKFDYQLPDEWKMKAYEEFNENPETILQEIAEFREKVKGVQDLRSRLDDCFLVSFLRAEKYNQEEALKRLQKYYKFRQECQEYAVPLLVSENMNLYYREEIYKIIQERDALGRMINIIRVRNIYSSKVTTQVFWRSIFTNLDFLLFDQSFHLGGMVLVFDFKDLGFSYLKSIVLEFLKFFGPVMMDIYPARFEEVHVVNTAPFINAIYSIVKVFIPKRLGDKIFVHASDMSGLCTHIRRETLPVDYGGDQVGFDNDWWLEQLVDAEAALAENATKYGYQTYYRFVQK